jgi:hypothetical protein
MNTNREAISEVKLRLHDAQALRSKLEHQLNLAVSSNSTYEMQNAALLSQQIDDCKRQESLLEQRLAYLESQIVPPDTFDDEIANLRLTADLRAQRATPQVAVLVAVDYGSSRHCA